MLGPGLLVLLGVVLAGCATPYVRARTALFAGHYDEATARFEEILAHSPDRLDARIGLGVARYKLGAYDDAVNALSQAAAKAPKDETVRLYLGLAHLRKGDDGPAEEELTAFLALKPEPRISAQVDRALRLMRTEIVTDDLRTFIAASLEDEAEWARQLREAKLAEQALIDRYAFGYWYPYGFTRCFTTRHGRVRCF